MASKWRLIFLARLAEHGDPAPLGPRPSTKFERIRDLVGYGLESQTKILFWQVGAGGLTLALVGNCSWAC